MNRNYKDLFPKDNSLILINDPPWTFSIIRLGRSIINKHKRQITKQFENLSSGKRISTKGKSL